MTGCIVCTWPFVPHLAVFCDRMKTSTSVFESLTSVFETLTSVFETLTSVFETLTSVFEIGLHI